MPLVTANGLELFYDETGDRAAPPLLLIAGIGNQMIRWDERFCAQLAARGHRVIRFDNRDVGLSAKLDGQRGMSIPQALHAVSEGRPVQAPYTLSDMAADTAGLLDALEIERAHIVGMSMGGMVAQHLTLEHPTRVQTLTTVMSSSGAPDLPGATPDALGVLLKPRPAGRDEAIARAIDAELVLSGPDYRDAPERIRALAELTYDRSFYPQGFVRQFLAILASGSRRERLTTVATPTLVVHGDADPLIPVECGIDIAKHVPGAELRVIGGWGHTLPPAVWPTLIDHIADHTR